MGGRDVLSLFFPSVLCSPTTGCRPRAPAGLTGALGSVHCRGTLGGHQSWPVSSVCRELCPGDLVHPGVPRAWDLLSSQGNIRTGMLCKCCVDGGVFWFCFSFYLLNKLY